MADNCKTILQIVYDAGYYHPQKSKLFFKTWSQTFPDASNIYFESQTKKLSDN